jgi:copper resistance protein D
MDKLLIMARLVHYASSISIAGLFAFLCFVAAPEPSERLRRRLLVLAFGALMLALVSGLGWLMVLSAKLSGRPLDAVLPQGVVTTVLTRTRFGQIWIARFVLAALLAVCVAARHRWPGRIASWAGLVLGAGTLGTLAWAGHGGATPGRPGELHLVADMLHLLAAGAWLGSLIPLALLLAAGRASDGAYWSGRARLAVLRFSVLAGASVVILVAAGLVNTWFLAGTVPALIGTLYGRLLLGKIAIFAIMVTIAAVNLMRMAPRLVSVGGGGLLTLWAAVGHLRRNALIEAGLGLCVLAIVGILGILPPGLHTEPGWPLPFRLDLGALPTRSEILLAMFASLAAACIIAAIATAAAGHYHRSMITAGGFVLCLALSGVMLQPAIEPAYPTSFYAPAEPYAPYSINRGGRLYAANCALCHGADGKGGGPAAAGLIKRPADLTAPHLFSHTPGDLFWWISNGLGDGAMPGFAKIISAAERWDVINFIRARAAGFMSREVGSEVSAAAAPAIPAFAFETDGRQQTLSGVLEAGPALLVLFSRPPSAQRLAQLAAAQTPLSAVGLKVLPIDLDRSGAPEAEPSAPLVGISGEVAAALGLFCAPDDGGETDLMLDRVGNVRARWTRSGRAGLPDAAAVAAVAVRVAQFSAAPVRHAGHAH